VDVEERDGEPLGRQGLEPGLRASRDAYVVAARLEEAVERASHRLLVLHDEDARSIRRA
jgi:hypothetical protein